MCKTGIVTVCATCAVHVLPAARWCAVREQPDQAALSLHTCVLPAAQALHTWCRQARLLHMSQCCAHSVANIHLQQAGWHLQTALCQRVRCAMPVLLAVGGYDARGEPDVARL